MRIKEKSYSAKRRPRRIMLQSLRERSRSKNPDEDKNKTKSSRGLHYVRFNSKKIQK